MPMCGVHVNVSVNGSDPRKAMNKYLLFALEEKQSILQLKIIAPFPRVRTNE